MSNVNNNDSDNYNKPFPTLLRTLMEKHKVTQETLGKEIGVTRQSISLYANGSSTPDIDTFQKIVNYFDTNYKVNFSYDYWLGNLTISENINDFHISLSAEQIGLSRESYLSLISFINQPEMFGINKFLENTELIQLFQDYLGNEFRDINHFVADGTKYDINALKDLWLSLGVNATPQHIYSELKIQDIIQELKRIKNKK